MRRLLISCAALLALAVIAGCGGGGNGSSAANLALTSLQALDGYATPTSLTTGTDTAIIGDNASNEQYRAFVSFDLTGLPANTEIESAKLKLYQAGDNNGYVLGPVVLEQVSFGTETDDAYGTPALLTMSGIADSYVQGYVVIDVTTAVRGDLANGRTYSQFRFFHQTATNNNGTSNEDYWNMAESAENKPELVIVYSN